MKKLFLLLAFCACDLLHAQKCDFQSSLWGYTITNDGVSVYSVTDGSPSYPTNSTYGRDSSHALISSGGATTITLDSVNTTTSPSCYLSFYLGAYAESGTGKGMDAGTDYVQCQYRLQNSSTWVDLIKVKGYSNAMWRINDESMTISELASSNVTYGPSTRGIQEGRVSNRFVIDELPRDSGLSIRFILYSDRVNEVWSIDDIELVVPNHWLNTSGDGSATNPMNWSGGVVPISTSAISVNDTAPLWNSGKVHCKRLITSSADTLRLFNVQVETGEWVHNGGVVLVDSNVTLSNLEGSGELVTYTGSALGQLKMKARFSFDLGWTNLSSPLQTTWSEVLKNGSTVNYGNSASTSVYGWDATNAAWYGLSNGSHATSGLPLNVFTGSGWIDSSNVLSFVGNLCVSDSAQLFYGIPNGASPFSSIAGNEGWNLIGNPFPYCVDLDAFFADVDFPVECSPTAYLWDSELGVYKSYNLSTGGMNGGVSSLAPWQAVWVQLNTDPGMPVPAIFKSEHRGYTQGSVVSKTAAPELNLLVASEDEERELRVVDFPGSALEFETHTDHLQRNKRSFEAYLLCPNAVNFQPLALKSLDPSNPGGIILEIVASSGREMVISAPSSTAQWYLKDEATGRWTDLSKANYTYWADGFEAKFTLWRNETAPLSQAEAQSQNSDCSFPTIQQGTVKSSDADEWKLFDLSGREVFAFQHSAEIPKLESGIYVWRNSYCAEKVFIP